MTAKQKLKHTEQVIGDFSKGIASSELESEDLPMGELAFLIEHLAVKAQQDI